MMCFRHLQIPRCSSSSHGLSVVSCWVCSSSILLEITLLDPDQNHSLLLVLFSQM